MPSIHIAHNDDELRRQLRQQGLAATHEATLVVGLDGEQDAAIMFPNRAMTNVFGSGFSSAEISLDTAHQIIAEIAPHLVRQPDRAVNRQTVTPYFERG